MVVLIPMHHWGMGRLSGLCYCFFHSDFFQVGLIADEGLALLLS